MADILCLDTEPETLWALKGAGHNVLSASFGYADGFRYLHRAPQDFDLIVNDLRHPACYDKTKWGPYGGNDNYKCAIIPQEQLTWEVRYISEGYGDAVRAEQRYHLISETQIEHMSAPSPFGPNEIRQAIALGGVPAILFLNPEWVLRTGGYEFPAFVGLQWETGETNAAKIRILDPLASLVAEWRPPLSIANPVRCLLRSGPTVPSRVQQKPLLESTPTVTDRIGGKLGQFVRCGEGPIWLLPRTANNAETACAFAHGI